MGYRPSYKWLPNPMSLRVEGLTAQWAALFRRLLRGFIAIATASLPSHVVCYGDDQGFSLNLHGSYLMRSATYRGCIRMTEGFL